MSGIVIDKTRGIDTRKAAIFNKAGNQLGELDIESLKCSVCHLLLRDAHQNIECGHRYCAPCVEIVRQQKVCPEDQEPVQEGSLRIDRGCQREIECLFAECPGKKNGCSWRESLLHLEEHMVQCQYVEQDCQYGCGAKVTKDALSCPNKPVPPPRTCSHCNKKIPPSKMEEHLRKDCRHYPVMCSDDQTEVTPGMPASQMAALEEEKMGIYASGKKPINPNVRYAFGGGGLGVHSANSSGYSSGSEEDIRSRLSFLEHQMQEVKSQLAEVSSRYSQCQDDH